MAIPKEPRQLMINLMYLVLTALLALNVSNEILNAFKTLSASIDKSNESINVQTNELYNAIKTNEAAPGMKEKVRPYRERADEIVKRTDALVAYLDQWKQRIIAGSGGKGKEGADTAFPAKMDNIDVTTLLLVDRKGGDTIKQKIMEMRQFLLEQVPSDSAMLSKQLSLRIQPAHKNDHNKTGDWNLENFQHMPSIAALALFSKFQNDVRSSENIIIKRLGELAHLREIKFDTILAVAVPKTTYALQGDKIEANILLAAFNKTNKPVISVSQGGGSHKDAVNGVIPWETVANGTGLQTVKGTLTYDDPAIGKKSLPWSFEYVVGTTGASLQLDQMNVAYIGVENPITVTAAGYAVEDVFLNLPPGGSVTGANGKFVLNVTQPNPNFVVDIMAKSKLKDGAPVKISSTTLRVKPIPNPVVKLLGKIDGLLPAGQIKVAFGPLAVLENFDFKASFVITDFKFSMKPKSGDVTAQYAVSVKTGKNAQFSDNPEVKKLINRIERGDRIFIEEVKAVGPDKKVRSLPGLIFTAN
jgi:gliding motility-associated protein GldM